MEAKKVKNKGVVGFVSKACLKFEPVISVVNLTRSTGLNH